MKTMYFDTQTQAQNFADQFNAHRGENEIEAIVNSDELNDCYYIHFLWY